MKRIKWRRSYCDTRLFLCFYPLLIIIGKVVRWTIMRGTLIRNSIGWTYPEHVINDPWTWEFFGTEELSRGDIGLGGNIYTFFKVVRLLFLGLPEDFYSFEICITVMLGILMFLVLIGMKCKVNDVEMVFVSLVIIVNSVYCFSLGKEAFQMMFFLLIYAVLKSGFLSTGKKIRGTIAILIMSVVTFRTYYILILVFSFAFIVIYKCIKKMNRAFIFNWKNILLVYFLMGLVYLVFMIALQFFDTGLYQRFWNALLYASDATSAGNTYIENWITPIIGNHVWGTWMEYMVVIIRLLFPLELLLKGSKYWPYILYQIIITCFMLKALCHMKENNSAQNIALIVFIGYVFMSAAFETDYGAWVRHSAVTFPIIMIMAGIIRPYKTEKGIWCLKGDA